MEKIFKHKIYGDARFIYTSNKMNRNMYVRLDVEAKNRTYTYLPHVLLPYDVESADLIEYINTTPINIFKRYIVEMVMKWS